MPYILNGAFVGGRNTNHQLHYGSYLNEFLLLKSSEPVGLSSYRRSCILECLIVDNYVCSCLMGVYLLTLTIFKIFLYSK